MYRLKIEIYIFKKQPNSYCVLYCFKSITALDGKNSIFKLLRNRSSNESYRCVSFQNLKDFVTIEVMRTREYNNIFRILKQKTFSYVESYIENNIFLCFFYVNQLLFLLCNT